MGCGDEVNCTIFCPGFPFSASASVEKRLSDLASLREKGLIDEEEYARKREQILSDL